MNWGLRAASFFNPQTRNQCWSHLRFALFHSTPVLERERRKSWDPGFGYSSRRFRKLNMKQSLLRNHNAYADYILQDDINGEDPSSSRSTSWFKKQYSMGLNKQRDRNRRTSHWGGKGFQFCDKFPEEEVIFRSAFGRNQFVFWSFMNNEEDSWRGNSFDYSNWSSQFKWDHDSNTYYGNWRSRFRKRYDSSSKFDSSESNLDSDRLALGLSASGPLEIEDVKTAYRACALKWHPDRHQGSSKAVAEERFKLCSAAYQSLCEKLAAA